MPDDITIQDEDDAGDSGSRNRQPGADTGANSSDTGSDTGTTGIGNGEVGRTGGPDGSGVSGDGGGDGVDSFGFPRGSAAAARENDPSRVGRGSTARTSGGGQRNGSSRGRSRGRTRETTTEGTGDVRPSDARPGRVDWDSLDDASESPASFTTEFVSEGWSVFFSGLSFFFKDNEWELDGDDSTELSRRTIRWLKTGDRKRAKAVEKQLQKWFPLLSLLLALIMILAPRIHRLQGKRNALRVRTPQKPEHGSNGSNGTAPAAPVPSASPPSTNGVSVVGLERDESGSARFRSLGREDLRYFTEGNE